MHKHSSNPEGVRPMANAFSVLANFYLLNPRLSLRSNHGLKLANAFGVLPCDQRASAYFL